MVWIRTLFGAALLAVITSPVLLADQASSSSETKSSDEQLRLLIEKVQQLEKKLADMEQSRATAPAVEPAVVESEAVPEPEETEVVPAAAARVDSFLYTEDMALHDDRDVTYGTQSSFLTWHGYLNFEFSDQQGQHSNFDNHEFYLATKARMSERVSFTAEFEYEHAPEKLILPIQAYADLRVSPALTLRAGLWYSPIGMPRGYTLRGNRNRMIRQVALTHDLLFENWADTGVAAFGELRNGLFYDVAIGNGQYGTIAPGDSWFDADEDLQGHTEDNNDNKALHSRVGYHAPLFLGGELNAAISYGSQKYDAAATKDLTYRGLDLRYLHRSGWRVQAEYLDRTGDDNAIDLANGMSADADAWYFQLSRRFVFNRKWARYIEPVIQIDSIDWNKHVEDTHDRLTTAFGFVFSPVENYQIKFEYDFVDEQGPKLDNNKLWLAAVVEF